MFEWFFSDFTGIQILVLMVSAVLIGINKTGLPGIGTLPVVLLLLSFEAGLSTGLQLMMLGAADVMAVIYYRRHASWVMVLRLMPWALTGIGAGVLALGGFSLWSWRWTGIDDDMLRPVIAVIILAMVALNYLRTKYLKNADNIHTHWAFTAFFGLIAGFTTLVANAAGPVMAIYLLAMRLPKKEYMGVCAWYFLILNWLKIPIFIYQGRITYEAFRADLAMLPLLLVGGFLGILLINKINQKAFEIIIQVVVVATAVYLLFKS
jgi:hypothetical protein